MTYHDMRTAQTSSKRLKIPDSVITADVYHSFRVQPKRMILTAVCAVSSLLVLHPMES